MVREGATRAQRETSGGVGEEGPGEVAGEALGEGEGGRQAGRVVWAAEEVVERREGIGGTRGGPTGRRSGPRRSWGHRAEDAAEAHVAMAARLGLGGPVAYWMRAKGMPLELVARMTGHADTGSFKPDNGSGPCDKFNGLGQRWDASGTLAGT